MAESSGGSLLAKQKPRPQLTLIPEEGRAINFRFDVAVVGVGAKDFAKMAVESEMAQAFHPKGYSLDNPNDGEAAETGGESPSKSAGRGKSHLTLFCPLGSVSEKRGLARLRLVCCESFSDSLPLHKEPTVAMNTAVVFLFWHAEKTEGPGRSATDERISDFTSRLAELNHGVPAHAKPYAVIYAFEADDEQEARLNAFTKMPLAAGVVLEKYDDEGEETVMDALSVLCENIIAHQTLRPPGSSVQMNGSPVKGKCCAIS